MSEGVQVLSEKYKEANVTGRWLPLTLSVVVPSCPHSAPSAESLPLHQHAGQGGEGEWREERREERREEKREGGGEEGRGNERRESKGE